MDESLRIILIACKKVAGPVTRITQNNCCCACIFKNTVGELGGAYLESLRKLEGDRGETPAAYPAFDVFDLEIEHQRMNS